MFDFLKKGDSKKIKEQKVDINKLIEQKNYNEVGKLLFNNDKSIKMESARALLNVILAPAMGLAYDQKYTIAEMFKNVNDQEILDLLLNSAKPFNDEFTMKPNYSPLVYAILCANGFESLLEILKEQGLIRLKRWEIAGLHGVRNDHHSNETVTKYLLIYATQMKYGIDVFIKIVPYGSCGYSREYQNTLNYIKTLPQIKIPSDQLEEIKIMFERRIKLEQFTVNELFNGHPPMYEIILDKITSE